MILWFWKNIMPSEKAIPMILLLLCKNHHAKITAGQNLVAPKARSKNASPVERLVYALLSFLLLLAEGIDNLIKICYELLAVGSA